MRLLRLLESHQLTEDDPDLVSMLAGVAKVRSGSGAVKRQFYYRIICGE